MSEPAPPQNMHGQSAAAPQNIYGQSAAAPNGRNGGLFRSVLLPVLTGVLTTLTVAACFGLWNVNLHIKELQWQVDQNKIDLARMQEEIDAFKEATKDIAEINAMMRYYLQDRRGGRGREQ